MVNLLPIKRKSGWDILQPNLLSEGVRLCLDMKIARMGSTLVYIPFWLLIERPRMTPYHNKLCVALVTKGINHMLCGDVNLTYVVLVACDILLE